MFCAGNIHYKLNEYGEEVEVADFLCIESSDLYKNYKPGIVYTEHVVNGLIKVDISICNYMYINWYEDNGSTPVGSMKQLIVD